MSANWAMAMSARSVILGKMSLAALFWGGTYITGKIVTAEMNAPQAALWRFLIAVVALLALTRIQRQKLPRLTARQWGAVGCLGLAGVTLYNLFFMYGLQSVQASRASLVIALCPAATMFGAVLFMGDRLTLGKLAGTALALLGVAIEMSNGNPRTFLDQGIGRGEIALFGCVLLWAFYTLLSKRTLSDLTPLSATTYAALAGTAMLVIVALARGELTIPHVSTGAWLSLAYMGVFGTAMAFVWYLEGVSALGPARAAIFVNLVPVAAITLGVLLLGERLTAPIVVGGCLVVAGIWLINRQATPAAHLPVAHAP
jgi:drug/metabolite transporter (DMT)-like permease